MSAYLSGELLDAQRFREIIIGKKNGLCSFGMLDNLIYYTNVQHNVENAIICVPNKTHFLRSAIDCYMAYVIPPQKLIELLLTEECRQEGFVRITDETGKELPVTVTKLSDNSVKVEPAVLRYDTEYRVTVPNETGALADVFGQMLPATTYNFKSAKSLDAAIDTTQGVITYTGDIKLATSITYDMKLTENAQADVTGVVAIYSANGTLIDMHLQTIPAGSDGASFALTAPDGGTEYVRMFLYEKGTGNMFANAKQRFDEITAK